MRVTSGRRLILMMVGAGATAPLSALGDDVPSDLYVIPFSSSSTRAAEMVLAQAFQGLTGHDSPQIWLDKNAVMSAVVLAQLEQEGTSLHPLSSVWELPSPFWDGVSGAIVYNLGTHSLNTAVSLCGPLNAVAVDESILDQAVDRGLPVIHDARGETEDQIFDDPEYFPLFAPGI